MSGFLYGPEQNIVEELLPGRFFSPEFILTLQEKEQKLEHTRIQPEQLLKQPGRMGDMGRVSQRRNHNPAVPASSVPTCFW